ncbi:MAG TPA: hypothetical protein VD861_00645 [Pyrinomonadaceae bacterium]|nr:hypothetical protein [Pyrinomonadaceae bacterium]
MLYKLALVIGLSLVVVSSAQAQVENRDQQRQQEAGRQRQEQEGLEARQKMDDLHAEGAAGRAAMPRTFKASVVVSNSRAKAIASVAWKVSLVDRESGETIRSYDVTTRTRIAPGKKKKLDKRLPLPRYGLVNARDPQSPGTVAKIVPVITRVTYEDGSFETPAPEQPDAPEPRAQ